VVQEYFINLSFISEIHRLIGALEVSLVWEYGKGFEAEILNFPRKGRLALWRFGKLGILPPCLHGEGIFRSLGPQRVKHTVFIPQGGGL